MEYFYCLKAFPLKYADKPVQMASLQNNERLFFFKRGFDTKLDTLNSVKNQFWTLKTQVQVSKTSHVGLFISLFGYIKKIPYTFFYRSK